MKVGNCQRHHSVDVEEKISYWRGLDGPQDIFLYAGPDEAFSPSSTRKNMSGQLQDAEKTAAEAPNAPTDLEDASRTNVEGQDIAIAIVGEHSHAIDPAVEARVVRKIDWYLVPAMTIGYGLVYYDKVTFSMLYL